MTMRRTVTIVFTSALFATFLLVSVPASAQAAAGCPPPGRGVSVQSLACDLAALTARVAALETTVGKLQGKNVESQDVAGTYDFFNFQTEKHVALVPGAFNEISSYVSTASFTLNPDGTGSVTGTPEDGSTLLFNNTSRPSLTRFTPGSTEGPSTFTWTYDQTAGTVTFAADNCASDCSFSLRFYTAGPAFIFTDANHGPEPGTGHEILEIGVRRN